MGKNKKLIITLILSVACNIYILQAGLLGILLLPFVLVSVVCYLVLLYQTLYKKTHSTTFALLPLVSVCTYGGWLLVSVFLRKTSLDVFSEMFYESKIGLEILAVVFNILIPVFYPNNILLFVVHLFFQIVSPIALFISPFAVLFLTANVKIKSSLSKAVRKVSVVGTLLMTMIAVVWLGRYTVLPKHLLENRAQCAWLNMVDPTWRCFDNWNLDQRRLRSENKDDANQFIELRIGGHADKSTELSPFCQRFMPVGTVVRPSPSGVAIPYKCFNRDGIFYIANWSQDGGSFQLIGKNVSREYFISNLSSAGYPGTSPKTAQRTINEKYQVKPTILVSGVDSYIPESLELYGTDLCIQDKNTDEWILKEQPMFSIGEGSIYFNKVSVKSGEDCVLSISLKEKDTKSLVNSLDDKAILPPGKYNMYLQVNYLEEKFAQQIEIL